MSAVYHFTCADHGHPGIIRSGVVIPNWHPIIGASIAWFTGEAEPDRQRTGLGMTLTRCDRMAYRFTADRDAVAPWLTSVQRRQVTPRLLRDLEGFGDPEHWFVASVPVPALIDLTFP